LGSSLGEENDAPSAVKSATKLEFDALLGETHPFASSEKNIFGVEAICCKVEQAEITGESVLQLLDVAEP
jgi:hypothetical protein